MFEGFFAKTGPRQDPDLIERLEKVEREMKRVVVEWEEWYDKYRRLYARISKRAERADAEGGGDRNGARQEEQVHALPERARRIRGF